MLKIIYTILILGFLVFVHEFGHFIAARKFGVKVDEFAIGMGPAILKKQKGETLYSLRILPIGGYCSMQGEVEDDDMPVAYETERSLCNKSAAVRTAVFAAGPIMNIITGVILMLVVVFASGLAPSFSIGVRAAFVESFRMIGILYDSLGMLFSGAAGMEDLSGPVGITMIVGETAKAGIWVLLYFVAFFSMNLAVINLLPFPALDGGRIFFVIIGLVFKGKNLRRIESAFNFAGLMILLSLMVVITFNDIGRLII